MFVLNFSFTCFSNIAGDNQAITSNNSNQYFSGISCNILNKWQNICQLVNTWAEVHTALYWGDKTSTFPLVDKNLAALQELAENILEQTFNSDKINQIMRILNPPFSLPNSNPYPKTRRTRKQKLNISKKFHIFLANLEGTFTLLHASASTDLFLLIFFYNL